MAGALRSAIDHEVWAGTEIDALVLAACALHGERASTLLEGLVEPLRMGALGLLGRWQRAGRAQRHAALETAFGPQTAAAASAWDIPGVLGEQVRSRLAPGSDAGATPRARTVQPWARRLALESGAP